MLRDSIERWETADELYSSLVLKEPVEKLKDKIAAYIKAETQQSHLCIKKTIYFVAMSISDEDTFQKIYEYLKQYGIYGDFSSIDFFYYHIYKLCSPNEQDKCDALNYKLPTVIEHITALATIAVIRSFSVKDLKKITPSIFGVPHPCRVNDNNLIRYALKKNCTDLILKICESYRISLAAALNIAIERPELFYGYIKENCFDNLPKQFKHGQKLRPVEKVIPFLLCSESFRRSFENSEYSASYIGIVRFLCDTIGIDNLKSVSRYFPAITTVSIDDLENQESEIDEIIDTIMRKAKKPITLTGIIRKNNNSDILLFFNKYPACHLRIDFTLLNSMLICDHDLLKHFIDKGADFTITADEKKILIKTKLTRDNKEVVKLLVKINALSPDTWDEAVSIAVEGKYLKALDALTEQYPLVHNSHIESHCNKT